MLTILTIEFPDWSSHDNLGVIWEVTFLDRMVDEAHLMTHGPSGAINNNTPVMTSMQKTHKTWGATVAAAFLANYMVCLAVWQATAAQDIVSKIFAVLMPVGGTILLDLFSILFPVPYWSYIALSLSSILIPCLFWCSFGYTLVGISYIGGYMSRSCFNARDLRCPVPDIQVYMVILFRSSVFAPIESDQICSCSFCNYWARASCR